MVRHAHARQARGGLFSLRDSRRVDWRLEDWWIGLVGWWIGGLVFFQGLQDCMYVRVC